MTIHDTYAIIYTMTRSFEAHYTVDDIQQIESRGPWKSKSGGDLNVMLALPQEQLNVFLNFENPEFDYIQEASGENIRGLRSYTVSDIPRESVGGKEWHRARTEYVSALAGAALWQCVDLAGKEREFTLDGKSSVIVPPGILHTFVGLEDRTALQVICNTLFVPEDPLTHDTYSRESFYDEQEARR